MERSERPRPHGDPLGEDVTQENQAQQQSDAPPDATAGRNEGIVGSSDRDDGRGSTANGIPASDEAEGQQRRKQYEEGAGIVSSLD